MKYNFKGYTITKTPFAEIRSLDNALDKFVKENKDTLTEEQQEAFYVVQRILLFQYHSPGWYD